MKPIEVSEEVLLDNLYVDVVLGRDLLESILKHYGKKAYNAYVRKLRQHHLWAMYSTPEPTNDEDHCMPVRVEINLHNEDFAGADLSGLDLRIPKMDGCNFTDADLSGSSLGSVARASFRNANLEGSSFEYADISGCDFYGAQIGATRFDGVDYDIANPPVHLPGIQPNRFMDVLHDANLDIVPVGCESRHNITARSVEICSFWGMP